MNVVHTQPMPSARVLKHQSPLRYVRMREFSPFGTRAAAVDTTTDIRVGQWRVVLSERADGDSVSIAPVQGGSDYRSLWNRAGHALPTADEALGFLASLYEGMEGRVALYEASRNKDWYLLNMAACHWIADQRKADESPRMCEKDCEAYS